MTDIGELLNMDLPALSELPPLITEQEYEKHQSLLRNSVDLPALSELPPLITEQEYEKHQSLLRKTVSFAEPQQEEAGDSVSMDTSED